jgi:hypothetical protein
MAAPLKATFFALRRRERGGVLFGVTATHVVLMLALFALYVMFVWYFRPGDAVASATVQTIYGFQMMGATLLFLFFYAVVAASYEAACLRWMIRGETAGFGGFSLGGDTWRVYGGYWFWFAFAFGVWLVVMLLMVLVVGALGLQQSAPTETMWIGWTAIAAWIVVITPFAIRMSAGNAASIAKKKLAYFDGWKVSDNRFWALFGSFLIAWLIWIIVFLALFIGAAFVIFVVTSDQPETADPTNVMMSGSSIFAVGAANLVLALLSTGVNARAVIAAAEEGKIEGVGTNVAAVFD